MYAVIETGGKQYRVAPGDVIASLSDAGGAAPQLYFEIREGRKTVDPRVWLRTNP